MEDSFTLTHQDYTVGWICALPTEMAAAVAMLDQRHVILSQDSSDENCYALGSINEHNIAIVCLPSGVTGTNSAATVAQSMRSTFPSIRFGLMVGIGGGVPSKDIDIRLGDVVVSKPDKKFGGVVQYDFGKTIGKDQFIRTGTLNKPPPVLLAAISRLEAEHMLKDNQLQKYLLEMRIENQETKSKFAYQGAEHDRLFEPEYDHVKNGDDTCENCDTTKLVVRTQRTIPRIHCGLIASGNQVMRHGATRERLRKELDVLCFEMEAAGLMDNFPCLVIRGICDYADSHKNKRWQWYAAATAAAYAKELLYHIIPASRVKSEPTAAAIKEASKFTFRNFATFCCFTKSVYDSHIAFLKDASIRNLEEIDH
jgi:nucleoside phosphorylase